MASIMPSGATDTFTGTDGSAWSATNWVTATNEGTGGSLLINGNRGRIRTGTTSSNRTSARYNIVSRQDAEILFDWTIPSVTDGYPRVLLRHSTSALNTNTSYYATLERDRMEVGRYNSAFSGTAIASLTYTGRAAGDVMRTRVALFGTALKARTWLASTPEDTGAWDISITDSTVTAAGYFGFTNSSASAGSKDLFIDNANIFDVVSPLVKALLHVGSITPTSFDSRVWLKRFAGSTTPSGALPVARRVIARFFTGSITAAGTLTRAFPKVFGGAIATSGTLFKRANKSFTATISISATIKRGFAKRFAGSAAPASTFTTTNYGRVFGVPGIAIMTIVKAGWARMRARRG